MKGDETRLRALLDGAAAAEYAGETAVARETYAEALTLEKEPLRRVALLWQSVALACREQLLATALALAREGLAVLVPLSSDRLIALACELLGDLERLGRADRPGGSMVLSSSGVDDGFLEGEARERVRTAIELYERAARGLVPRRGPAEASAIRVLLKIGAFAYRLRRFAAARRAWTRAAKSAEGYSQFVALENSALLAAREGEFREALALLEQARPLERRWSYEAELAAVVLFELRRYEEAARLFGRQARSAAIPPAIAEALERQGWALLRAGDGERARRAVRRALKLRGRYERKDSEVTQKCAELLRRIEQGDRRGRGPVPPAEEAGSLIKGFSDYELAPFVHFAAEVWRAAFGDEPTLAPKLIAEADLLRLRPETEVEAAGKFELALSLERPDARLLPALRSLWSLRRKAGRVAEAVATARRWLTIAGDAVSAELADTYAEASELVASHEFAAGRQAEALAQAESAFVRCTAAGAQAYGLADTIAGFCRALGEADRRYEYMQRAIELAPEYVQFERKIGYREALIEGGRHEQAAEVEGELARAREEALAGIFAAEPEELGPWAETFPAAVRLLEPYVVPTGYSLEFRRAPFAVLEAVAELLGRAFLVARVNARPSHARLLEIVRPHAGESWFDGKIGWPEERHDAGIDVDALHTRDSDRVARALGSADELTRDGERLYAWWD